MFSSASLKLWICTALVLASPAPTPVQMAERATCTVSSVASAGDLSGCTDIVITAFTVPSGSTLEITAATGATIVMKGNVEFAKTDAEGPLMHFDTKNVNFNGNGYSFIGNGELYWDTQGGNGGVYKPGPLLKFDGYGTFANFNVKNSPVQAISIGVRDGQSHFKNITVDNSDGDKDKLGHNTDGFDLGSVHDVVIQDSKVYNQDDCVAIGKGSNIVFKNNYCSGGHGISIGSISTNGYARNVTISDNTVVNNKYGLRIKVKKSATNADVTDVTYSGNTVTGASKYGVLITQSYDEDFGTPGTGSQLSGINFSGTMNTIAATGDGLKVGVDCGNCTGTWDWSALTVTSGKTSQLVLDNAKITGGSY
ncbi:glycoside hydrolase family 28 protein [Cylindrobasidium torrendii FP15055 ss-10]|uniref:endo-polygalacturonase n=1 Tax=Cylindrobasidium torrendii FP15055 ss-10 TaxID=1314674 RepID=A0A0D7AZ95_9AGAR|nr:glycoside hydrolase family 28 protein [Cylindrobasidium torrendii FP15055 ss-10]